ncbi:MAG: chloride channel protein [Lachnospiraceae bacterium]|nr:chloride channel protein [Lachnospiraceae bacterium]
MKIKLQNELKMLLLTALLGAVVGAVLWCFLKATGICTGFIWEGIAGRFSVSWLPIPICTLGGLIVGLLHKFGGDYPEELDVVLKKIKEEKHYDYRHMLLMLLCAFFPLIIGASVGPEAGLCGIIAGLCYWIGDNVKYAREHKTEFSQIGEAVTLGELFHMPLFGIFEVEEEVSVPDSEDGSGEKTSSLKYGQRTGEADSHPAKEKTTFPKASKLVLYGLAALSGYLVMSLLSSVFGAASEGFPSFDMPALSWADFLLMLLYIPTGILLCWFFEFSEHFSGKLSDKVPVCVRETLCGAVVGCIMIFMPLALFSGEEEMREFMVDYGAYAPLLLVGICFLKLFMTAFCIRFGLKGGHFFPVIFSCVLMGFALSGFIFAGEQGHSVFAAGIITAAALGAQLKKPFTAAILLLLCFPAKLIIWFILAAAAGSAVAGVAVKNRGLKT